MTVGSLGKRYARALLALARQGETLEPTGQELTRVADTFADPRLHAVLTSPAIDGRTRAEVGGRVIDSLGVSKVISNLLAMLIERDRLSLLPDISRAYEDLLDTELGRVRAVIRSAAPLSVAERAEIVELIRRVSGRHEVKSTTEVDPELLGGVVLHVGSKVYDGSLKSQLVRLSKEMAVGSA